MSESIYLHDIPLPQAWSRWIEALRAADLWRPLAAEDIALESALGRVTAAPIWAKTSSPHYHASAMDGYAIRAADTQTASDRNPVELSLPDQAAYVDTGEAMPDWADAVIPIEDVEPLGGGDRRSHAGIRLRAALAPWSHVRPNGRRHRRQRAGAAGRAGVASGRSGRDRRQRAHPRSRLAPPARRHPTDGQRAGGDRDTGSPRRDSRVQLASPGRAGGSLGWRAGPPSDPAGRPGTHPTGRRRGGRKVRPGAHQRRLVGRVRGLHRRGNLGPREGAGPRDRRPPRAPGHPRNAPRGIGPDRARDRRAGLSGLGRVDRRDLRRAAAGPLARQASGRTAYASGRPDAQGALLDGR